MEPLAQDLGLTVDTSCDRDDQDCVADAVDDYNGPGNVLICWEHDALHDIVKALGDKNAPDYPDDRYSPLTYLYVLITTDCVNSYNLIWTDPSPYKSISSTTSENCPGLDD